MTQYKTIEQLKNEMHDNENNVSQGIITAEAYYIEKKRIQQAMAKVDTRPNCTFSADPTPEQSALRGAKDRCFKSIEPYKNRIGIPKINALRIALTACSTIEQVERLYNEYRGYLDLKNIVNLPDFNTPLPQPAAA